ncbi:MAG: JAB domain-containing protein [Calditrichaeota bacterium]|nr:MAG: JAB domain-containing protein [Calditrichota bacterium]
MAYLKKIKDWPLEDRPREKLLRHGPEALSDAELLAIILRVGGKNMTAIDLARQILQECGGFRGIDKMDVQQFTRVHGIGQAKAAQIKAAITIGKRLARQRFAMNDRIQNSQDVYDMVHLKFRDLNREVFCLILLTSRNKVISEKVIFEGTVTQSMVSPREVVREIINAGAAQVIFVHNHPSGEVTPSEQDLHVTQLLKRACETIEVSVLDHIIIGDNRYYSFADEGRL